MNVGGRSAPELYNLPDIISKPSLCLGISEYANIIIRNGVFLTLNWVHAVMKDVLELLNTYQPAVNGIVRIWCGNAIGGLVYEVVTVYAISAGT